MNDGLISMAMSPEYLLGRRYDGGGTLYRDAPIRYDEEGAERYDDYVARHSGDEGFDKSIYSSDPRNLYSGDDVTGYSVLPEVSVAANAGRLVRKRLINQRAPGHEIPFFSSFANRLPNLFRRGRQAVTAASRAVTRRVPFLREESGAYVKDLSGSYLARVTPETKNVKSILGNQFVEEENKNTIRPAKYFRTSSPDTLLGDRKVPLRRISRFLGFKNGKFKIGPIGDFADDERVVPVWNRTDLVTEMQNRAPYGSRDSAYSRYSHYDDLYGETGNPAYKDSSDRYYDIYSRPNVFKAKGDSLMHMPAYGDDYKSMLVSPNGNSMFINNAAELSECQRGMVNSFLKDNGGAYPIMLDNGRYAYFLEGKNATYDNYVSSDFYRDPESFWAFGEVGK